MKKRIALYDDYNGTIHRGGKVIGTIRQTFGQEAFRNGWKIIEIYEAGDDPLPSRMEQGGALGERILPDHDDILLGM